MTQPDPIRTRHDGSIDTAYYMARGRHMRSLQAHAMIRPPRQSQPKPGILTLLFGRKPA